MTSVNYRDTVVKELVAAIEAGTAPWQKPWTPGKVRLRPFNPSTDKSYRGMNSVWLEMTAAMKGYEDPRWLTWKQARALEAQVRSGEKATKVEYWQWHADVPVLGHDNKPRLDADGKPVTERKRLQQPRVFYANVFNAEQIDGLEPYRVPKPDFKPLARAEAILTGAEVTIAHDQEDRAVYRLMTDSIHMPPKAAFDTKYGYYATALHEVAHATMHESRLNRDVDVSEGFGSPGYAREELRAEIASMIMAGELGIGNNLQGHADYAASWLKALKENPNEIFHAARDAEIISTWVTKPELRAELKKEVDARKQARDLEDSRGRKGETSMAINREDRHYINVPFAEKDEARAAGAKWDRKVRSWYVPKDADRAAVAKWDRAVDPDVAVSPVKKFGDFIRAQGLALKGDPVMDGEWHRVPLQGQVTARGMNRGSGAGSYKGWPDGKPNGLVQNFRDGDGKPVKWVASGVSIDPNERAALKAEWEAKAAERRAELERQQDATAKRAWNTWSNAIWANPDHCEYLAEKGLKGHGVKMTDQGGLLVPVRDIDGRLHSLQYITRVSKAFLKNSRKSGCMHVIDPNRSLGKGPIIIAEGYATAASIHEATGRPVVTAFDAGNLEPVAAALRGRYPGARIVLAADDDHRHERNAGIEKAEKAAAQVGGTVIVVQLTAEQKRGDATDFDDLRQAAGFDAVRTQIEDGLTATQEQAKTGQKAASVVIDATGKAPEAAPGDVAETTTRKAPPKRSAVKTAPKKAAKRSATKSVGKSGARSADKRVVKKDPRKSAERGMAIGN